MLEAARNAAYLSGVNARSVSSMQLTEEDIKEFQAAWKSDSGQTLTMEEARECATRLLHLYLHLARALPGESNTALPTPSP